MHKRHADLKPENIMVKHSKLYPALLEFHIIDMSLATSFDEFAGGRMGGTPNYMSPEMINSFLRNKIKLNSQNCVDGYGLALLGVYMYGNFCAEGDDDILCFVASLFFRIHKLFERRPLSRNNYNFLFKKQSHAMSWGLSKINQSLLTNDDYVLSANFMHLLATWLIRVPNSTGKYPYVDSSPSKCISWTQWRKLLRDVFPYDYITDHGAEDLIL